MNDFAERVIFEDNHFLIFNKLPGEIVQADKTKNVALVEALKQFLKEKYNKPGNVFLGLAHRLDRPTSGLVIFAKTSKGLARINDLLKQRKVNKTYWAVTENKLPLQEGTLIDFLKKNEKQNKSYPTKENESGSKKAVLHYKFLAQSDRYFLYEINLETGRHHQIRAQLAARNSPIKGDLKYGAKRANKDASIHLHARELSFEHPISKTHVKLIAPAPQQDAVWQHFEKLFL